MKLSSKQKAILYGSVLGDGYLQKTGKENARLRLEHSYKQNEYIHWKYEQLNNIFPKKPVFIERIHPKTHQKYQYLRLQSHSSPVLGKLRRILYDDRTGRRIISEGIVKILKDSISLAVWYMDDGYYYKRDRSAHIYVPYYNPEEMKYLVGVLSNRYHLKPKWYCRPDRKGCQLNFVGEEKERFFSFIKPYLLPYFHYKLP